MRTKKTFAQGHRPRKRFGQNFLQDPTIIDQIIQTIHPQYEDSVVEIGPGLGALTQPLLDCLKHLDVIEIDRDLAQALALRYADPQHLSIYIQDALKFDFHSLVHSPKKLRIIGNLPYNISTPLIFHLLNFSEHIEDMHFMLQKEVVERLCAQPPDKEYGRLSLMTQYYCEIHSVLSVPPTAFYPVPKVKSAFVRLKPYPNPPYPAQNFAHFQTLVRVAFTQRRKTIANALKAYLTAQELETLNIDPKARPETLSLREFVQLSNYLKIF
jgi:16S rRNA (adenine1518-N6/adenine1519-N6)-dimethyltransferase